MLNDNNFFSGGGGFYPTEISQSLRFNDDDAAYLTRTPTVAGNRKTWTFSAWVKRGNLGSYQFIFGNGTANTSEGYQLLNFHASDYIEVLSSPNNAVNELYLLTTQVFRDPSAWYHIVLSIDTTQSVASDRAKLFVNGVQITSFSTATYPAQNTDLQINRTISHEIGKDGRDAQGFYFDGYLAEVHFTDGTAYTADAFGEFKSGVWVAKQPSVTYGTNGFYLNFASDYAVEGFNTVTYKGTGSQRYVGGVGFSPDLVWIKARSAADNHILYDSVRGVGTGLYPNLTAADTADANGMKAFDSDGFTIGINSTINGSGVSEVAWCWDAGTGSPVSNTNGTITSTVKANPASGFSIVTYTGNGSSGSTVGHGLNSKLDLLIVKNRGAAANWLVRTDVIDGTSDYLFLNTTAAQAAGNVSLGDSSTFVVDAGSVDNTNTNNYVAYCFHSVAGYSKVGTYTGTGATGNVVTTGFKPAFILVKRTDGGTESWWTADLTRNPSGVGLDLLSPNNSGAEVLGTAAEYIDVTDTGFILQTLASALNTSGATYLYMAFADTREAGFFLDQSGNNNDFTPVVLTESDVSLDSPTNNFATLNVLGNKGATETLPTFYEGNLKASGITAWSDSSIYMPSGKYYWEASITTDSGAASAWIGVHNGNDYFYYNFNAGTLGNASGNTATGKAILNSGDIVGVALDVDLETVSFYANGVLQATVPASVSGTSYRSKCYFGGSGTTFYTYNFGQDSSFAGTKTPQGNTDANGRGDFYYAPPTGYLALCTANLPEPAISPANDVSPQDHMNTVLYTGDGDNTREVTGVGFQPDFTWIKRRNTTGYHALFDAVRGATNWLYSNATDVEDSASYTNDAAFLSDGFKPDNAGSTNALGSTYVAWNWRAGGTPVSNTNGTITSSVSANTESGFSIVTYAGTSAAATVGHGLTQAPDMVIVKSRTLGTGNWCVFHKDLGGTKAVFLNLTLAEQTNPNIWNNTAPTSSVIHLAGSDANNGNCVAYCFHSVEGFSKFGIYTGNGSTDGPFVYTGFRPAFVMIKQSNAIRDWHVYDDARDLYNVTNDILLPNSSVAEFTDNANGLDFLSNGFKWRTGDAGFNGSGGTYIYMAFAEMPFRYSNAR